MRSVLRLRLISPTGLANLIVPQMNRVGAERSDQRFVYVACD